LQCQNIVYAWCKAIAKDETCVSCLFQRKYVLVLYDPTNVHFSISGAKFAFMNRQLIVAMSPNERHQFTKPVGKVSVTPGNPCHYLGPPSESQLFAMLPWMIPCKSLEVFRFRYGFVGPLPAT
jgi:hypothetical protein